MDFWLTLAITLPVCEFLKKTKLEQLDNSEPLKTPSISPFCLYTSIFVPAVMYKPASIVQLSPRGIPTPALAPIKQFSPIEIFILLPPERVPIVLQPPPRSELSPTTTPADILPSIMIEGRISAGVVVGDNSDLGGGCSTMGTLSGGNNIKISIGENCLIGANAGVGIPLGDNCTIEAGLYITAGTKIEVYKQNGDIDGVFKGSELSNCSNLVFLRNSQTGKVIAKVSQKSINLNSELHKND